MRFASLALRTLLRLDLMSSRGIRSMSEALWSSERKCSETVVGLELFVCIIALLVIVIGRLGRMLNRLD